MKTQTDQSWRVRRGRFLAAGCLVFASAFAAEAPFIRGEFIIPPERVHNHGSCLVEVPNGDLIVCWFHGTGERTADDCKIEGARWHQGAAVWGERFDLADTPAFPDTNCCMFIDPQQRLWLIWPTILDNHWESALLKYRWSEDYRGPGAPVWKWQEVLHVKPGPEFERTVKAAVERFRPQAGDKKVQEFIDYALAASQDKLKSRLGWMTRAHPFVLDGQRLIVPLYSDGFNFSLMAITDDWGRTWHTSAPLVGDGNVQPSIVRRRDSSLYTMMRDNGRPPQRIQHASSFDRGETWTEVTDSALTDPGKGLEVIALANGHWIVIHNDTDSGRHSLCARVSDDEGKTWKWSRHLERDEPGPDAGSYSYPSLIQAKDGTVHVTYSYVFAKTKTAMGADARARETIKHRQFNEAWIVEGER